MAKQQKKSPRSKAGILHKIKKAGIALPRLRDMSGKFRSYSREELREVQIHLRSLRELGMKPGMFNKTQLAKNFAEFAAKKYREKKTGKKEHEKYRKKKGLMLTKQIERKEGRGYVQAGSMANFLLSERDELQRKIFVRRQGRLTEIKTESQMHDLIKAVREVRRKYRQALRDKFRKTGLKISDIMFFATERDKNKNVIMLIDEIEYTGLTNSEINQHKLR